MFRTLQARLTAGVVTLIAATVVALGLALTALFGRVLQDQYATTYVQNAHNASDIIRIGVESGQLLPVARNGALQHDLDVLSSEFHFRLRVYVTPDTSSSVLVADSGWSAADPARHLAVDDFSPVTTSLMRGDLQLGLITVSEPLTDRTHVERQFAQTVLWVAGAACLLAFGLAGLLSRRLTAPFRVLTRATARIAAGNLGERVPEGRRDEAGELARQFNHMAAHLEESFGALSAERDRLRQFVADVSHELRTPLTALRTFNDLLRDGAVADSATRRDFLAESARQIERLDWLTHNLLDLSRLDAGITPVLPRPADLSDTLRRAVEANRPAAAAKGITLILDAAPLVVAHDPPRLEQALGNVVANAIKFSPPGTTVQAHAYAAGPRAVVDVCDEGPGIPPHEAPHVFDRFYRGHAANRAGEGSGLGLSIARAIVDAHGGAIAVAGRPEQSQGHGPTGTTMRLTLPRGVAMDDGTGTATPGAVTTLATPTGATP